MAADAAQACAAGEWSTAVKLLTAALQEKPRSANVLCNRALCYSKLELHKHALEDARKALAADPNFVLAYLRQGEALLALGKRDAAAAAWDEGYKLASATGADMELTLRLHRLALDLGEESAHTTAAAPGASRGSSPGVSPRGGPPLANGVMPGSDATQGAAAARKERQVAAPALSVVSGAKSSERAAAERAVEVLGSGMLAGRSDLFLSVGIQQVNAGKLDDAIATFEKIMGSEPRSVGALIGRGTALALQHKLELAVRDFTQAIDINPDVAEAWKRRAQARAALGTLREALEDFSQALRLDPSCTKDVLLERGTLYAKLKDYRAALQDLRSAASVDPKNKLIHNVMGLALVGSGECVEGVRAYKRALDLDPGMHDAWLNLGQAHKELADALHAAECFQKALELDPRHVQTYRLWALLKYGCGDHRGAGAVADKGLSVLPSCIELHYIKASANHALGEYATAVREYDTVLGLEGRAEEQLLQFLAFYQREIALYTAWKINEPLQNFRLDSDMQPFFKEAWCKKLPPTLLFPGYTPQPLLASTSLARRRRDSGSPPPQRQRLLDAADRLGRRTQYSCPGFLPNTRQHRMAGLAVLEIMQTVIGLWGGHARDGPTGPASSSGPASSRKKGSKKGRNRDRPGQAQGVPRPASEVAGSASSGSDSEGGGAKGIRESRSAEAAGQGADTGEGGSSNRNNGGGGSPGRVSLGWRDVFNIAVRWRQVSEPCDGVAWVDLLTRAEFEAGFGSHTPILIGQTRVVRYYSNFQRAFRVMKQQILSLGGAYSASNEKIPLSDLEQRRAVEAAKEPQELHDIVGEDFWIVTPCYSLTHPGKVLDGTRLTLVKSPTGYDFAIRTPGTPKRWTEYDSEMTAAWEEYCAAVRAHEAAEASGELGLPPEHLQQLRERIQNAVLRLGFFWYNFMPLARGTAMVGYVTMLGLLMAANMEVTSTAPRGVQVDWEAILSPRFEQFAASVGAWMFSSLRPDSPFRSLPRVSEELPTLCSVVAALSASGGEKP